MSALSDEIFVGWRKLGPTKNLGRRKFGLTKNLGRRRIWAFPKNLFWCKCQFKRKKIVTRTWLSSFGNIPIPSPAPLVFLTIRQSRRAEKTKCAGDEVGNTPTGFNNNNKKSLLSQIDGVKHVTWQCKTYSLKGFSNFSKLSWALLTASDIPAAWKPLLIICFSSAR